MFFYQYLAALKYPFDSKKRKKYRKELKQKAFLKNSGYALEAWHDAVRQWHSPVRVWLEFGTLLGAYREKRVIAHDYDLDFAIDEDDCTKEFVEWLQKFGFKLHHTMFLKSTDRSYNGFAAEYVFRFKDLVNVDLFVCKKIEDRRLFFAFDAESGLSRMQTQEKYDGALRVVMRELSDFSLKDMDFLGLSFKAPTPIECHLEELYGADFMTPKQYSFSGRPKQFERLLDNKTLGVRVDPV